VLSVMVAGVVSLKQLWFVHFNNDSKFEDLVGRAELSVDSGDWC